MSSQGGKLFVYLLLVAIVLEVSVVRAGRDYYDILGVSRDADSGTIKRAFRRLAKEHHPDKNKGNKASEKLYVELNNAYEVLSDPTKRQQYDMYGEAGVKNQQNGGGDAGSWGFDPFESMFGGGRRQHSEEEKTSPNMYVPLAVSLETMYVGGVIEAVHNRKTLCSSWSDCESPCPHCGGSGIIVTTRRIGPGFIQQIRQECPHCGGTGKIRKENCTSCPEGQFEEIERPLLIDIEPGYAAGTQIPFEGQADEIPDHAPGALIFELDEIPHPAFVRQGHDLHYDVTITLTEALIGVDRAVRQLDGRIIPIKTSGVTVPNQVLLIPGEGMPNPDNSGDAGNMVVRFWVDFPSSLTDAQRKDVIQLLGAPPQTEIGNGGGVYNSPSTEKGGTEDSDDREEL